MSIRVRELAEELKIDSKELTDKVKVMGIDVKSQLSVLSDMDAITVRNRILHKGKESVTETQMLKPEEKPAKKESKPSSKKSTKSSVKKTGAEGFGKDSTMEKTSAEGKQPEAKSVEGKSAGIQHAETNHTEMRHPETRQTDGKHTEVKHAEIKHTEEKHSEVKHTENKQTETRRSDSGETAPKAAENRSDGTAGASRDQRDKKPGDTHAPRPERRTDRSSSGSSAARSGESRGGQGQKPHSTSGQSHTGQQGQSRTGQSGQSRTGQQGQSHTGYQGQSRTGQSGQNRTGQQGQSRTGQSGQSRTGQQGQSRTGQPGQNRTGQQGQSHAGQSGQNRNGQNGTGRPRPQGQGQNKPGQGQNTQKSAGGTHGRKDQKNHGQNQGPKREYKKLDLTKAAPKKHAKYKSDKPAEESLENQIGEELPAGTKIVNVPITVKGLSEQIEKSTSELIMKLMKMGIMANINQNLDEDTVVILGEELGIPIVVGHVEEDVVEEGLELFEDKPEDLKSRPPIITVMGHVDHGKTSLLDAIRSTNVTDKEAGGITQHIGASEVHINGQKIVFLDTPGHEAFTAMRARGAYVTDIAVLVVAADDSVKPQTIEAISHAKAAGVPIIVAINKMDKPGADIDKVKQDLTEHGILVEEWGGDVICVPVSAKSREGIDTLLEMILLQSEMLELKANPNRLAMGTVIEARLDKAKGPVATLLVTNGALHSGMSVVAGTSSGRIRAMTNFKGDSIRKAGPGTAVEILGLTDVPEAGDEFNAVREDKMAREIAENRKMKLRQEVMARNSGTTLEELFSQIQEGVIKELNLIIKADVQGSAGALITSLEKLRNENVKVRIIHFGVGTVTESDIMLAHTTGSIIIAFNVRPSTNVTAMADRDGVEIRNYRVIYEVIDDIEAAMKGMLDPVFKEVVLGKLEIRNTFKVPGAGLVGGAYVLEGKVQRNAEIRLVRDGIVIHEGKIASLRRFKDDVKEVAYGYECGIGIENYNDIKEGDIVEAFKMEEIERK